VHEVAKSSSITLSIFVLPTTRLAEIRDWGEFCIEWPSRIPPVVQVLNSSLRFCLPFEAGIDVADQMVTNIVTYLFRIALEIVKMLAKIWGTTHMKLEKVPKLRQFTIQVLVNRVKTLLKFLWGQTADRIMGRVMVNVGK